MQTLTRAQINRSNNPGADDNRRAPAKSGEQTKEALATIIIKRDRIIAPCLTAIPLSLLRARRLLPALVSLFPPLALFAHR